MIKTILLTFCLMLLQYLYGQNSLPLRFETINQKNGLSNNWVKCLYKDADGFLWVGTEDGLNKYDGTKFKVYRHFAKDSTSLVGNQVMKIRASTNGKLWVSSNCWGLSEMNVYSGKSEQYKENKVLPQKNLTSNCYIDVLQDDERNTWVKNGSALSLYHPKTKTFSTVYRIHNDTSIIHHFFYRKGILWLATLDGTIGYNTHTKQVIPTPLGFNSYAASTQIIKFINDDIIISGGWEKGFNITDIKQKRTLHLFDRIIVSDVKIININQQKQLWVSTDKGLFVTNYIDDLMSLKKESFQQYLPSNNDLNSIASNFLGQILQDDKGIVWIATANGLNKLNPSYFTFKPQYITGITEMQSHYSYSPSNLFVHTTTDGKTSYWLSYFFGAGLLKLDSNFNLLKRISFKSYDLEDIQENRSANISIVFQLNKDTLVLASWGGIWLYDALHDRMIKNYMFNDKDSTQPKINGIMYGLYDNNGKIWVGTYTQKLRVLDIRNNTWQIFDNGVGDKKTKSNRHDYLFRDSRNRIWLSDGCYFNEKREIIKIDVEGNFNAITEDKKGNIWLASENGVGKFNEATKSIINYNSLNGLLSYKIGKIIFDDDNNLWATSTGGLICINDEKKIIRNFTTADGLEDNSMVELLERTHDGNFITSVNLDNNNHFTIFNPKTLLQRQADLPLHLTAIQVLNKETSFDISLDSIKELHFSYTENLFSIHFKALEFTNNANIHYRYKLIGISKSWIEIGTQDNITFTNLSYDTYTLEIQATNTSGIWMDKILSIKIIVHPPFWRTTWFAILVIVLIAAIAFVFIKRRIKAIKIKAALTQQLTALEIKALRSQMNPHFIFNCLSSIQATIMQGETEHATEYVDKFSLLLRTVLNQSERPSITLQEEVDYLTTYLQLETFRYEGLQFTINAENVADAAFIHIPSMLLQPFIENAIQHGLSHKVGKKMIEVVFEEEDNIIKVTISDNGIGRAASKEINKKRTVAHQSLGIKNIEDRLQILFSENANIIFKDEEQGTKVIIQIPIINN